jgi:hypothetical protein
MSPESMPAVAARFSSWKSDRGIAVFDIPPENYGDSALFLWGNGPFLCRLEK